MEHAPRLFQCALCHTQSIVCSKCDRGQIYCGTGCAIFARKMAMYIARKYGDYRLQEIADVFGLRHYGGVSSTVHLFMKELQHDPDLREKVSCVLKKLQAQI